MIARALIAAPLLFACLPALAQDHSQHSSHARPDHSAHQAAQEEKPEGKKVEDHSQHQQAPAPAPFKLPDMTGAPAMDHSAHSVGDLPKGPPPPEAFEGPQHAADAFFGAEAMAAARAANHATHGDMKTGTLMLERLEARIAKGEDGYLWDLQGWYGGDIDKFVLKSEGEGEFGGAVEDAEVQALWGHAIGPFFDLQAGVRLDLEPETRSHLVLGVQGLAPYMWHVDGAFFLSDRGDLTARIEGEYDQKITQALILQPRIELELSAQDIPEREIGAGLTKIEPGLRLRYEIAREFAPYVGVEYEAKVGETADIAKAAGEDPDGLKFLLGVRAWF